MERFQKFQQNFICHIIAQFEHFAKVFALRIIPTRATPASCVIFLMQNPGAMCSARPKNRAGGVKNEDFSASCAGVFRRKSKALTPFHSILD